MNRTRFPIRQAWAELRRRHVVRVIIYYAVFSWVVIQVGDVLLEAFDLEQLLKYLVAGVVVLFPIVLALSWMFDITSTGVERTQPLGEPFDAPAGSLAVMPFANLSDDAENEYFSEGLSEEIRNHLAGTPGLKVAARTSSFVFKDKNEDAREIGRRLNVATLLEGGVRRQGGTVRIGLQLVNTSDGYQVWSERFERQLEDIFGLQQEIATQVSQVVRPLTGNASRTQPSTMPQSFDAYNLYLRGRHFFHQRTEAALRRAVNCFEGAIALDAGYALAWSGLSDAWTLLGTRFYGNLSISESTAKAAPAAQRALELEPALAQAHASMGLVLENSGELDRAAECLRRAQQLDPAYSMSLVWYGLVLVKQKRFTEAAQCNLQALSLDPLSPIINVNVGFDFLRLGDAVKAQASFETAVEISPEFPVAHYALAQTHSLLRDFGAAERAINEAIRLAPLRAFYRAYKSLVLLQKGDTAAAYLSMEAASQLSPDNPFDADLAVAHYMVRKDQNELLRIATGGANRQYDARQRGQAHIALGNYDAAREMYDLAEIEIERELVVLATDDWVWKLPHPINRAHLWLQAGDSRGPKEAEDLLAGITRITDRGVRSPLLQYWTASTLALLGRQDEARRKLEEARRSGWSHRWWEQLDWNIKELDPETSLD